MIKIGINGFGRIGRALSREILKSNDIKLVKVNDIYDKEMMLYLLKYDSVYGHFLAPYDFHIGQQKDIKNIDWSGVDIVVECSGVYKTKKELSYHLKNGAKTVILSSYSKELPTYIAGVNEESYKGEKILSNSSCTANCVMPVLKILDKQIGIKRALLTTIHSYTSDQSLLDNKNSDQRRARSATKNLIPLPSGVAEACVQFLPHLKGKISAKSVRVPLVDGVLIDANIELKKNTTKENILDILSCLRDKRVVALSSDPIASSDIIGSSYSSIVDTDLIQLLQNDFVKLMLWQDNEYGYVKNLTRLIKRVSKWL